jgi:hypothetical protein
VNKFYSETIEVLLNSKMIMFTKNLCLRKPAETDLKTGYVGNADAR